METDLFGTVVEFEDLKPGELFIANSNDTAVFGIATKFPNDERTFSAMLKASPNEGFDVVKFPNQQPVWKVHSAIVRPTIKLGRLQLVSRNALGGLILATNGTYLICKRGEDGSIARINLDSGLVSLPSEPSLTTTNWEIGIRDSTTQEWCTIYESVS